MMHIHIDSARSLAATARTNNGVNSQTRDGGQRERNPIKCERGRRESMDADHGSQ